MIDKAMNTLFGLEGKVAVVTGGSRGIGLMAARGLLQAGARVYLGSRKADVVESAVRELSEHGDVVGIPADFSTEEGCVSFAEAVGASESQVDILVNNAGTTWGASIDEFPAAAWNRVLDLNLKAPFFLTQAFLAMLRAAGTHDDPSRIINIGSVDGIQVQRHEAYSYGPSKAAIHHLTKLLAFRLGEDHITVNAIAPGAFDTKMIAAYLAEDGGDVAARSPLNRIGRDDDIAGGVIYLSSRAGAYLTGAVIPIDGGVATTNGA